MTKPDRYYSDFGIAQSRVWEPGTTCITIAANIAESAVLGVLGCFPDSVLGFTPEEGHAIDAYFVKYLLDVNREQLTNAARGTTQDNLSLERLLAHSFRIPEAGNRSKIARTLKSIDDLIENNQRRVGLLEEMTRTIYREWFVHFRFPGHGEVPLIESPLGPIPAGWDMATLGDLATEIRQSVRASEHTASLPYVPIEAIAPMSISLPGHRPGRDAASSLRLFGKGDVLFGAMRAYFHKVCVAPFDGVTRSTCFVLRPDPAQYWYSVLTLADRATVEYAAAHSSGSTIPYAKWDGVLSKMTVVRPPENQAQLFGRRIAPLLRLAQALSDQASTLSDLRDLLLPKLVTGQIDVSQLDLDALVEEAVG